MSEQSKARRQERRREEREAAPEPEPTARLYGLWLEPGRGWRRIAVELPRSVALEYAIETSEPDVLQVTLGRTVRDLEREAMQRSGVAR